MTKREKAMASPQDILDHLAPADALAVLRILARDESWAPRIRQLAMAYLEAGAPDGMEDATAIVAEVQGELEQLEVEDVWDRAGPTRDEYVETGEVADEMIQGVLDPYLEDISRYQALGMELEATYLCMGLLQGLYQFEHESASEFKNWATDLPAAHAEAALAKWRAGSPPLEMVVTMRDFAQQELPHWALALARSLPSPPGRSGP